MKRATNGKRVEISLPGIFKPHSIIEFASARYNRCMAKLPEGLFQPYDPKDQTLAYDSQGKPVFGAELPEPPPDMTDYRSIKPDVLVVSDTVRKVNIGDEHIAPEELTFQPRRGEIIEIVDQNTLDRQAYPYRASTYERPFTDGRFIETNYGQAAEVIPREAETRSLTATAMHEAHTRAHWTEKQDFEKRKVKAVVTVGPDGVTGFFPTK